ncbi:MAG: hypothetical protein EP343_04840 [Deltaproteobacteria bacterium]|nr:MAG: hypothetical protein EP343_04840 [Deltaproteobacteria bacterium]
MDEVDDVSWSYEFAFVQWVELFRSCQSNKSQNQAPLGYYHLQPCEMSAMGQIDPTMRALVQTGAEVSPQPGQMHSPMQAYLFKMEQQKATL